MSPEVPMFRRGRTSRLPQHQTPLAAAELRGLVLLAAGPRRRTGRDEPSFSTSDANDGDRSGPGGG
jgi:hypothetical protein